ncbi:MAG: hypothetical protein EOP01_10130, partial [Propionibacteriaceae bacterium]
MPRQADRPAAAADLDRQVLASGTALVLERVEDGLTPLGAYAGVPVSCEDQVVSVLSVCDELGRTISRRDVAVLLELAELWSIELCRAQDAATVVDPVAIDLARGPAQLDRPQLGQLEQDGDVATRDRPAQLVAHAEDRDH